jgi:hypothetical protein
MKICRAIVLGFSCVGAVIAAAVPLEVVEGADQIMISRGKVPVLTYHKAEMPPPAGESELFRRSGFIHPLHAPNGDVVTSIHPADHIHHMGLWHAWVKTKWQGEEIDFWNLKGGRGTVRFVEVLHRDDGGFKVRQKQVALAFEDRAETVVLDETLEVAVTSSAEANVIDYTITQTNVSDAVLEFPAYRYGGGITFRAPETWGERDDSYLTSTGLDRTEGHATRGDWVVMHGPTEQGSASVVIMGHPSNHDAPQRMRIWPKGKVFFNYVPAQEFDWAIAPGETVVLRYRVVIESRRLLPVDVRPHWQNYSDTD